MCGVSLKRQSCLHERGFELPSVLSLLKVLSPTRAHNVSRHASCRAQHSSAGWRQGPLAMLSRGALCSAPFFTGCGLNREWSGATLSSAASSSADCFLPSTPACLAGFVASFEAESVDCTRPRVSATSNSARRLACRAAGRAHAKENLGAFLGPVAHVRSAENALPPRMRITAHRSCAMGRRAAGAAISGLGAASATADASRASRADTASAAATRSCSCAGPVMARSAFGRRARGGSGSPVQPSSSKLGAAAGRFLQFCSVSRAHSSSHGEKPAGTRTEARCRQARLQCRSSTGDDKEPSWAPTQTPRYRPCLTSRTFSSCVGWQSGQADLCGAKGAVIDDSLCHAHAALAPEQGGLCQTEHGLPP